MKKYSLLIITLVLVGGLLLFKLLPKNNKETQPNFTCSVKEMIFYFQPTCHWCQQVEKEKTIEQLEKAGVKVQRIDVSKEVPKHQFSGVPTFVINNQVYTGYRTLDDLKTLLDCR